MSYDVQVFARQALDLAAVQQLLADAALAAEPTAHAGESLTVVRGARAGYCFTLGMPVPLEAEDIPAEVTAVLIGAAYLYDVMVEGSSPIETPHAVRFARRLAQASGGVVLDQQAGGVWARGKLRAAPKVPGGTIDVVTVQWYVAGDGMGAAAARSWLELAHRHLPEALPRRFGAYEPLSMKLAVDGPDAFVQAVDAAGLLFFKASAPCIEGHLHGGAGGSGVRSHSLSVHREILAQDEWRTALRRLFIDFAAATGAFFASAEVQRGLDWSGRTMWHGATAERTSFLAPGGRWMGLLPYPPWWAWFGAAYRPLVLEHLPADRVDHPGGGVFHARSDRPVDRDELTAALCGTARTWLPPDLLLSTAAGDQRGDHPASEPATKIPKGLRRRSSLWRAFREYRR